MTAKVVQIAIRLTTMVSAEHEIIVSDALLEPGMEVEVLIFLPSEIDREQLLSAGTVSDAEGDRQIDAAEAGD